MSREPVHMPFGSSGVGLDGQCAVSVGPVG